MRALLVFAILCYSAVAHAAATSFEAYDFKRCRRWAITNDVDSNTPMYSKAKQRLRALTSSTQKRKPDAVGYDAEIFSMSTFLHKQQNIFVQHVGVCTLSESNWSFRLKCASNQDFPLAGATYSGPIYVEQTIGATGVKALPPMKCVAGCRDEMPLVMYSMHMEDDASDASREWNRIYKRFQRMCKRHW
jgi:hypothetical protein